MDMMRGAITVRLCCSWCDKVTLVTAPWRVCRFDTLDTEKALRYIDEAERERSATYEFFPEEVESPHLEAGERSDLLP